ncbi:mediator complex subunit Med5-domain-containing protein [Lipomyces tetrasporus]
MLIGSITSVDMGSGLLYLALTCGQGDLLQTAIQLILASFDVLANAVFRNEGAKDGQLLKSYLVNKVPLILRYLVSTSTMYSLNAEFCITEALGQVDTNVFPTLSNMFDISNTNSSFHDSVRVRS